MQDDMKVTVEETGPVSRKVTVEVTAADVDRQYAETVKEYRRKVAMPGFRKGKVPADVIRRMYAGDLAGDVARAVIEGRFPEAYTRAGVVPVSEPQFEIIDLGEGKPFSFSAAFEIRPAFEPQGYLGIELSAEPVEVKDDEIDRLLEEIRENHATVRALAEPRGVRKGDVAVITFEGSVAGAPIPQGAGRDFPLVVGDDSFPPGFEDNLIGATAGETREFVVRLPDGFSERSMAGKDALFKVTVGEVRERVLPELDDAFAKDVGDYAGLDDLRGKLRENVRGSKEAAARGRLREAAAAKLAEANPVPVPPSLVEARRDSLVRDAERYLVMRGVPWEQVQKQRAAIAADAGPTAERKVRVALVLDAIAEREQLSVAAEELAAEIAKIAASSKLDPAEVRRRIVQNGTMEELRASLLEEKALDFVVERAKAN